MKIEMTKEFDKIVKILFESYIKSGRSVGDFEEI